MFNIPIAFICFNRFEITKKTFSKIKKIKPKKIYLILDYPRINNIDDNENNKNIKDYFDKNIDWECTVIKDYSQKNLGLKKRIISGLQSVFSKENSAIVLEDDCYPHDDFFYFCEELLTKYKNHKEVMFITGNNFQDKIDNDQDYYFSKYTHIWGWATWKSTWNTINFNDDYWIKKFSEDKNFIKIFPTSEELYYWKKFYYSVLNNKLKSWSIYLLLSVWEKQGLTATPKFNLVENLDLVRGTNTRNLFVKNEISNLKLNKPLKFNGVLKENINKDYYTFKKIYSPSKIHKIKNKLNLYYEKLFIKKN